ncbi:MAG: hypothetical protein GY953_54465 [bacterium]|nr:hypothetical protein [bacterium]
MNCILRKQLALILLAGVILSCSPKQEDGYVPVLATPSANEAQVGTLRGDFDAAARSSSLQEAASRWQEFIRAHRPADGEYEDEFQKNLVDAAHFELMRAYYLLGQAEKGDAVLKEMNPLQL